MRPKCAAHRLTIESLTAHKISSNREEKKNNYTEIAQRCKDAQGAQNNVIYLRDVAP